MKRGLHINSYYFTNRIHYNFRKNVLNVGNKQLFFIPTYKDAKKMFDDTVEHFEIYNSWDKKFFFTKIVKGFFKLKSIFNSSEYDFIHAHTLISDGLIGYITSLLYHKPLVVTIRNTDVNFFIPNKIFYFLGAQVLKKSSSIIFLSPSYQKKMEALYPFISDKDQIVLPNGIDEFWINNLHMGRKLLNNDITKLVFVGKNDNNKNLVSLLRFLEVYNDRNYELSIVGENTNNTDFDTFNSNSRNKVKYYGEVTDKNTLKDIYRGCDIFVLLSLKETFGISYVEAMSQGLPIIYTKNEGIDGYFEDGKVGYSCEPTNLEMLRDNINKIIEDYETLSIEAKEKSMLFSWHNIIEKYKKTIINNTIIE